MMPTSESVPSSALDEEHARAELYGLLAVLYYAPPALELIAQLRLAAIDRAPAGAFLDAPWQALVGQARSLTEQDIQAEYEALFGGVGKPEIYLYSSYYLSGFLNEKPLARLRTELVQLGLTRDPAMSEPEDHIAYLCEVMRYLIVAEDITVANLTRQRAFFTKQLQSWVTLLCEAIEQHPNAHFYAALAALTAAFLRVETEGFEMLA